MKTVYVVIAILLVVTTLIVAALVFSSLPERVPTHWNIRGQVDGYGPRSSIFILPGVMAALLVLFWIVLPAISPKSYGVEGFRATYDYVALCAITLTAYFWGITLWATLYGPLDPGRSLMGGMSVFLILIGNVMGKVRRNFWLGVRTPWTLADERVWNATHRVAGWAFVLGGSAGLLAVLLGLNIVVCLVALMLPGLVPVIYSLVYYKRLERRGEL
jgi:uncharacterized membrane protein